MPLFLMMAVVVGAAILPVLMIQAIIKGVRGEEYSGYMAASILASLAVFWPLLYIIIIH